MSAKLRHLRDTGIEAFRGYLWKLRQNPAESPPRDLLTRPDTSQAIDMEIILEETTPGNRYEMACYLLEKLAPVQDLCQPSNAALWSWLSLYYFDLVCPVGKGGSRFPGKDYRHIPESSFQTTHRHLLSGPFHLTRQYGQLARFLLTNPINKENRLYHQICGRQNFVSNPAIMEAAHTLYRNPRTGGLKPGSVSITEPGGGYRFITIIQQLELTYDLFSMSAKQILSLLPQEFDPWSPPAEQVLKIDKS